MRRDSEIWEECHSHTGRRRRRPRPRQKINLNATNRGLPYGSRRRAYGAWSNPKCTLRTAHWRRNEWSICRCSFDRKSKNQWDASDGRIYIPYIPHGHQRRVPDTIFDLRIIRTIRWICINHSTSPENRSLPFRGVCAMCIFCLRDCGAQMQNLKNGKYAREAIAPKENLLIRRIDLIKISHSKYTIRHSQQSILICWRAHCTNVNVLGLQTKNAKITIYHRVESSSICGCAALHRGVRVCVCVCVPIGIILFLLVCAAECAAHTKYQTELWILINKHEKEQKIVK